MDSFACGLQLGLYHIRQTLHKHDTDLLVTPLPEHHRYVVYSTWARLIASISEIFRWNLPQENMNIGGGHFKHVDRRVRNRPNEQAFLSFCVMMG